MADQTTKKPDVERDDKPVVAARPASTPLVFISHDSRDADLAEAFCQASEQRELWNAEVLSIIRQEGLAGH
jgi:hypothetical protein